VTVAITILKNLPQNDSWCVDFEMQESLYSPVEAVIKQSLKMNIHTINMVFDVEWLGVLLQ